MLQGVEQGPRGEERDPGGGQLEREGQPVQAPADAGHGGGVGVRQFEGGVDRLRPVDEQAHRLRADAGRPARRGGARPGGRKGEGRDGEAVLSGQAQRGAARRQHREPGAGRQELPDRRGGIEHVLAVVEHQEQAHGPQRGAQRARRRPPRRPPHPHRRGDGRQHERRVVERPPAPPAIPRPGTPPAPSPPPANASRVLPAPPGPVSVTRQCRAQQAHHRRPAPAPAPRSSSPAEAGWGARRPSPSAALPAQRGRAGRAPWAPAPPGAPPETAPAPPARGRGP